MRFQVTINVDVDVDGYAARHHITPAEALVRVLADLNDPRQYLTDAKWNGVASIFPSRRSVKAQLCVFTPQQAAAIAATLATEAEPK